MDPASLLTDVLQAIEQAALTGFGLIEADAGSLALMIAKISGFAVLLSALIAPREFSVSQPVALLISLYAIGFLMAYFQPITQSLLAMMEQVGLAAGGNTINIRSLKDVGAVAAGGWTSAGPLVHALADKLGWDFYNYIHYIFFYLVCIFVLLVVHILLAFRIFFLYLEYSCISTVAYFLLPTAVWGRTTYLAERAIGYVVSVGISLLLMGFLYSLVHQYVASIHWGADMKIPVMINATGTTVILVVAVLLAGRAVRALQYGAPNMNAGGAFRQIGGATAQMWMAASVGGPWAAQTVRSLVGLGTGADPAAMARNFRGSTPGQGAFRGGSRDGSDIPAPPPTPATPEARAEAARQRWREDFMRQRQGYRSRANDPFKGSGK